MNQKILIVNVRALDEKQLFWFFMRWISLGEKPNVLFVRLVFCMKHNVSAMVSTGFQRTELSDLHLAKFLIFPYSIDTQN